MKPVRTALLATLTLGLAVGAGTALLGQDRTDDPGPIPEQPEASPLRLLAAQPFSLDEPYLYEWRADRPLVEAGWLVAVAGPPETLQVRQTHGALLFAGDLPGERINGERPESAVWIGILPSPVGEDGLPTLDLGTTPLFFARPEVLPESMSVPTARVALDRALERGAAPQPASAVASALEAGGGPLFAKHRGELYRLAADLVERWSPVETDLVAGLRAPLVEKAR